MLYRRVYVPRLFDLFSSPSNLPQSSGANFEGPEAEWWEMMAIQYRMIVEKERRHCQHQILIYCSQVPRRKKLLSVIQYALVRMQARYAIPPMTLQTPR